MRWTATLAGCALTAGLLTVIPAAPDAHARVQVRTQHRTAVRSLGMSRSVRMQHRFAEWSLRANGITWHSSGQCSDRNRVECTSLEGIRWGSIDGLIAFKRRSGCPIVVSGGTERGHAKGRYSHWNGYKIDVMPGRCVDQYVVRTFRYTRVRGDGAKLYQAKTGAVYAQEVGHWDILFG